MLTSRRIHTLKGTARVPGDKSISHRALMLGAIAEGDTTVIGLLEGEDVLATAAAMRAMGAAIVRENNIWRVTGVGMRGLQSPEAPLDLGNSGTSARLLMGLVAGYGVTATFTGDASLSRRPMARVMMPLANMGAVFTSAEGGRLPVTVKGRAVLDAILYTLPVASAQLKSAIILAALHADGETVIIEPEPTRDHSERMLMHMGAQVDVTRRDDGANVITVKGGRVLRGIDIVVPADPSSAAFLVVAALIVDEADISLTDVLINPTRNGLYETLVEMGADITIENIRESGGESVATLRVKSTALKGITVPAARVPSMIDEFPVLAVAAAFAEGDTVMTGLAELRVKESDRLSVMAAGLTAAGVAVTMGDDSLIVHGRGRPQGGVCVATHLDHRIAMSFLVMGLGTISPMLIDDASPIMTSFPGFVDLLNGLGAEIG